MTFWRSNKWRKTGVSEAYLAAERVRELLSYDPDTGVFTWLVSLAGRGGGVQIGKVAGSIDTKGRRQIKIDGHAYFAHRLAFLWMTGEWPADQVDHRDRDHSNNRWLNLREASPSQNAMNRKPFRPKHDLPRGAHALPSGRYAACIQLDGRLRHIGVFDTAEAAHTAYETKAREVHGAFYLAA